MNLSNLKYIVEVEKTGSITRAAQNFYMNQPHLSRMIRELEKELGFSIFERTGRGMVPTQKGEEFLRYAKVILAQEERIEALRQSAKDRSSIIRLAAARTSYLPAALASYLKEAGDNPPLKVSFLETSSQQVIRKVAAKDYSLGLLRCQELYLPFYQKMLQEENLESRLLWNFSLQVVLSAAHPLAAKEPLTYLDLKPYPAIASGDSPFHGFSFGGQEGSQQTEDSQWQENVGSQISVYDRGSQLELLCRIPGAYLWDSPIPEETLKALNLVQRPCSCPGNSCCDLFVWRRDYRISHEEQRLLIFVEQTAARLGG